MIGALVVVALVSVGAAPSEAVLRRLVAETALAQLERMDPAWEPQQRDCAGLVRFAYREAFRRLWPARLDEGPWRTARGEHTAFADASTLIGGGNFVALGRDADARAQLDSGDLVVFRQEQGPGAEPAYHLMLVVRPEARAHESPWLVYHPGAVGAELRAGKLRELAVRAPREWRPSADNPAFLGFFRLKEWTDEL